MSELKITGNPTPVVGKDESYSVNQLLPTSIPTEILNGSKPNPFEFPVEWSMHVLENGRWIKKEENNKTGNKVSYKFSQLSLTRKGIRILAKKGEQTARLDVKPHNAESPKIDSIEFLDKQGKKPTIPLAYGQTLKARIHCLHMERRKVYATLCEDNDKSKENIIIETRFGTVIDGIVDIDFTLRPSGAHPGLNKDESHKYYVTTVVNNKNMPSNPVNAKELEAPVPPYKKKTPLQQPNTPTAAVAANGVGNVYITDINGQPIQGTYKSKKLKVWIESKGLQGKEIKLTIYDEDVTTNDLIYHNNFKISKDLYGIEVHLDKLPISKAGRLEGDIELFVDIEVLQNQTHTKSGVVNVDAKAFKQDSGEIVNTVLKVFDPSGGDEKKTENGVCVCKDYDLIWGNKVSCDFRKKVLEISKDLWPDKYKTMVNGLMAVMKVETSETFSPSKIELVSYIDDKGKKRKKYQGLSKEAINKLDDNFSGAVGLIQFTKDAIDALNKENSLSLNKKKLALMTDVEQLEYVKKYFMLYNWHKKLLSPEDIYLQVFAPIGIAKNDNYVLYQKYENPETEKEKTSTKNYNANKSVDQENNNDNKIQRVEILGRYRTSFAEGLSKKEKEFSCGAVKDKEESNDIGILDEMKALVDKHIPYSQLGVRNSLSEKGLKGLDCSETVSIYLTKLGISTSVKEINTGVMTTQKDFRKAIDSENIDFVSGSVSKDFKPKRGDIFVWRRSDGVGHTGIVYDIDEKTDLVTILEAIGNVGSADETTNNNNGGYSGKGSSRTAVYKRTGKALSNHAGWKGYFRPKNYTKKL
jgi:hypothetical protein